MLKVIDVLAMRIASWEAFLVIVALSLGFASSCMPGALGASDDDAPSSCLTSGDASCDDDRFCSDDGSCIVRLADGGEGCNRDRMCASDNCVQTSCCPASCAACVGLTCLDECGDAESDAGEECDQGLANGVECTPPVDACTSAEDVDCPPTCTDGVLNQGEINIDCGGPCPSCETDLDADYYLSAAGDDSNDGTSRLTPYRRRILR